MNKCHLPIALIILLLGFPQISETIYTPSLPQMTLDLQTSAHLTEMTLSIYFVGFALGVALWGYSADAFGRRKAMLGGLVLYTLSCFFLWNSLGIQGLLFWRFFQALGASAGSVVTQTMLRDLYEGKKRHQIFAVVSGALAFVPAIGPLIGSYLCLYFGWECNFLFLCIFGFLLLILCYRRLPETRSAEYQLRKYALVSIAKKMLADRNILIHVLLISLCNGIIFGFYGEAPFLFINLMEISLEHYGLFGSVLCVAGLAASFVSHRLNEHYAPQQIILGAAFCTLTGSCILMAAAWANMFHPAASYLELSYIICGIALSFLGIGLMISNSLSIALNDYKETVGIAGSLFGLLYYLGIAFFMGLVSLLHNGTAYTLPFLFLCYSIGLIYCSVSLRNRIGHVFLK